MSRMPSNFSVSRWTNSWTSSSYRHRSGGSINYLFYAGKVPSLPDRTYIHQFHEQWWANYRRLEYEHGFIQWLFPVFESSGVNWDAEALDKEEAKKMREDFEISTRVIRSYRLMLNFYGMRLMSVATGEIARWPEIWRERYDNLNWSGHNSLRITRILTSLGELGFQRYKKPWLDFLTNEITQNRQIPNCRSSLAGFWSKTIDYASPMYKSKTKEDPEDREDSVFFRHMEENSPEYQKWQEKETEWLTQREQGLEEAQKREKEEQERDLKKKEEKEEELRSSPGYPSYSWKHDLSDEKASSQVSSEDDVPDQFFTSSGDEGGPDSNCKLDAEAEAEEERSADKDEKTDTSAQQG